MKSHFPLLRELLCEEPSTELWEMIYELFQDWSNQEDFSLAVSYANLHMQDWPDSYRKVKIAVQKTLSLPSIWPLVREIDIETDRSHFAFDLEFPPNIQRCNIQSSPNLETLDLSAMFRNTRILTFRGCRKLSFIHGLSKLASTEAIALEYIPSKQSLSDFRQCPKLCHFHVLSLVRRDSYFFYEKYKIDELLHELPTLSSFSSTLVSFEEAIRRKIKPQRETHVRAQDTYKHLTFLDVGDSDFEDSQFLEMCPSLRVLRNVKVPNNAIWQRIAKLTNLEELEWTAEKKVIQAPVKGSFSRLRKMTILPSYDLQLFSGPLYLPALTELGITGYLALVKLPELSHPERLTSLFFSGETYIDIPKEVQRFQSLEKLVVKGRNQSLSTAKAIEQLQQLPRLRHLDLQCSFPSLKSIQLFRSFPSLEKLRLGRILDLHSAQEIAAYFEKTDDA